MEADVPTTSVGSSDNPSPAGVKRKRRPRAPMACGTCRARKVKCDGCSPCSNCVRHEFSCSYKEGVGDVPKKRTHSFDSPGRIQQRLQPQPMTNSQTTMHQPQSMLPENLHPSPVSLDEPIKHEQQQQQHQHQHHSSQPNASDHRQRDDDSSVSSEHDVDGLGQVNEHTEGAEFYGPTGTFYFLARLRSRANTQKQPEAGASGHRKQSSIVNLLHSSDYSTPPDSRIIGQSQQNNPYGKGSPQYGGGGGAGSARRGSYQYQQQQQQQSAVSPGAAVLSPADAFLAAEIERECVRLYFQNLHNIHPILEQASFLKRCEEDIWSSSSSSSRPPDVSPACSQMRREGRFLALYHVVVAIGAITAGETSLLMEDHTREFLDRTGQNGKEEALYPPIRLARRYFERSRLHLEDICESSSLETAQTLFLMRHGHQDGVCHGDPDQERIRHEPGELAVVVTLFSRDPSEMCFSAGRQSGLRAPNSYSIPFPKTSHFPNSAYCLINPMVDLAKILMWMTDNLSLHCNHKSLQRLSQTALDLDRELDDWKSGLPRQLRFDLSSLEDSEFAMKQKTVLKLRFLNARILLHRQFIISKALEADRNTVSRHVKSCVNAATDTIRFMHTSYLHRPYFRTWWYNCMYLLDACMVLLHVLISNICPFPAQEVMEDIELSLDIFKAMKMLAVARRCADIVRELLSVAAKMHRPSHSRQNSTTTTTTTATTAAAAETEPAMKLQDGSGGMLAHVSPGFLSDGIVGMQHQHQHQQQHHHHPFAGDATDFGDAMIPGDFDANLVDPNVVWNFLNFEHWNAWSDAAFR
ncbi:C6 transcription factor [Colletotrichum higginsianum IMI 349063]|uniref:C6 transcription factor n=1 Tax=Colletotrichum higginsianum (strain IMI 349063) TaxID=759273 RepID=A0A1B7XZV1_COLHI|nr:C6 transcription factor [Colletotrichum higginsianum IMI 349063]OBR05283.1 C6 transcription factor [Colletotrichum higginsianum IMI 349063]